ncbi:MAG: C1 family peptidase, partial [Anaerolineae bacterium]
MSEEELFNLQRAIDDRGHTWRAGETSLSSLPPEEQKYRLGLTLVPEEMTRIRAAIQTRAPVAAEFPPAWDWRNVNGADWTTRIRDQKACGSCVAFGTVGVLEAMVKRHENDAALQPDLSEAHLFFCGCGNCCDKGWWPS